MYSLFTAKLSKSSMISYYVLIFISFTSNKMITLSLLDEFFHLVS